MLLWLRRTRGSKGYPNWTSRYCVRRDRGDHNDVRALSEDGPSSILMSIAMRRCRARQTTAVACLECSWLPPARKSHIPQLPIEVFAVAVLPGTSRFAVQRPRAQVSDARLSDFPRWARILRITRPLRVCSTRKCRAVAVSSDSSKLESSCR
jgi:hypothetical protein